MFLVSYADSFTGFLLAGLGFGLAGASFAVGIAYTSVSFPSERQGTALGTFDAGNNHDGWRIPPRYHDALKLM